MWITMAANVIAEESGLSRSTSPETAFSLKRLVREYGASGDRPFKSFSIAGTISHADVYNSFVNPRLYKLSIIKTMYIKRKDFKEVCDRVKDHVYTNIEVIPVFYV